MTKKVVIASIKIGLSIAILALLFYKASQNDGWSTLTSSEKKWGWLLLGFVFLVSANMLSFWRWHGLLRAVDIHFSRLNVLRIGFIGFMFGSFSVGMMGNDAVRIFYTVKKNAQKATHAVLSVFVDRLCGFLGLLLLASGTVLFFLSGNESAFMETATESRALKGVLWSLFLCTSAGICGFAGLFLFPLLASYRWVQRLTRIRFIGGVIQKTLEAGIAYQRHPAVLLISLSQSVLVHVLLALSVFSIAIGLSGEFPAFSDHLVISPIAHFAQVLPLPGGIGAFEAALDLLYDAVTAEGARSYGMFVGLVYRLLSFGVAGIGAACYFYSQYFRLFISLYRNVFRSVRKEEKPDKDEQGQ